MESESSKKDLFTAIWDQKVEFFLVFFGIVTITYGVLFAIDFIPEPVTPETEEIDESTQNMAQTEEENAVKDVTPLPAIDPTPNTLIIDKLNKRIAVLNPSDTSVAALDQALLSGIVRHPESADYVNEGTMFMFGHSSYLPNVINKNFQAFNGIQDLTWGDRIRVQTETMEYVYRVERVYEAKASEASVDIERGESRLTLATCNTFGSKDDRYIVESKLIDSYPLGAK